MWVLASARKLIRPSRRIFRERVLEMGNSLSELRIPASIC